MQIGCALFRSVHCKREMLDRLGLGRGISDEELRLPPSDKFGPVAQHLDRAMAELHAIADDPPGTAPRGLMGPFYRMTQRSALKRIKAALKVAHALHEDLGKLVEQGDDADPDFRESVRNRLEDAQPTLRKGLEGAGSYHAILLDDAPRADSMREISRRLMISINAVTEERFNFGALFEWLEEGKQPDTKLLAPPTDTSAAPEHGEPSKPGAKSSLALVDKQPALAP